MPSFFEGIFDFRSKEDKEKSYAAYCKRIFPYGDSQKDKIAEFLIALFPKQDKNFLMMHYISIKDGMTDVEPNDFETVAANYMKKGRVRFTPELKATIKVLLQEDLKIDEKLNYPSVEEIREEIKKEI